MVLPNEVSASTIALVAVALLFAVYVIVQVRPGFLRGGRRATTGIREAHDRARTATTPDARALALVEAGEVAAKAGRWISAAGSFLRAFRSDPSSALVVTRTAAAMAPRPRLLESLLLRKVATFDPATPPGDPALVTTLEHLRALYEKRRDKGKARLVELLLARRPTS